MASRLSGFGFVDAERAKVLQLHKDGASLTEIAGVVGAPRSTVQRALVHSR
jgi:hypothetical protein